MTTVLPVRPSLRKGNAMKRIISTVTAVSAAMALLSSYTAFADSTAIKPAYPLFNKNDVNGCVTVNIPDKASAKIKITFDSPEGKAENYYSFSSANGGSFSFDIEGHDNTDDDYRNYSLSVILTGGAYDEESEEYTDTFTVPDVNDNPDSFFKCTYNFSIDDKYTGKSWDETKKDGQKNIAVHLDAFLLGDVDGDGKISAADATDVLQEYSALSTGKDSSFSSKKKKAADVNKDGSIDASDATSILAYYSALSTNGTPTWI